MAKIHIQRIGDKVLLAQSELDWLIELAQRHEKVVLKIHEDDMPTVDIMRMAEQGKSFEFWMEDGEDIYSATDGEAI